MAISVANGGEKCGLAQAEVVSNPGLFVVHDGGA